MPAAGAVVVTGRAAVVEAGTVIGWARVVVRGVVGRGAVTVRIARIPGIGATEIGRAAENGAVTEIGSWTIAAIAAIAASAIAASAVTSAAVGVTAAMAAGVAATMTAAAIAFRLGGGCEGCCGEGQGDRSEGGS